MENESFPDFYADSINVASGPYGYALTFLLTEPNPGEGEAVRVVGRLRLSPELAKALAEALTKATKPAATSRATK